MTNGPFCAKCRLPIDLSNVRPLAVADLTRRFMVLCHGESELLIIPDDILFYQPGDRARRLQKALGRAFFLQPFARYGTVSAAARAERRREGIWGDGANYYGRIENR